MSKVEELLRAEVVACIGNARKHVGDALMWGVETETGRRHLSAAKFWQREASTVLEDLNKLGGDHAAE